MQCPQCQHENPSQSKFCFECGGRLVHVCTGCGAELPGGVKFCNQCGHPVGSPAAAQPLFAAPESYTPKHLAEKILTSKGALEGERKQVTVLFADLKGSMELLADRDPEEARKLLDPVLERMMEAVHRYEGTVNQVMGDGIMALFGAPLAHEDHAVRACYAALRMQERVKQYADEVHRTRGRARPDPRGPQLRRGRRPLDRERSAHGLHGRRPDDPPGRADGADGDARLDPPHRRDAASWPRATSQVKPLGPSTGQGARPPGRGVRADGASAVRSRLQAAAARGLDTVRRPRRRAGPAAPGAGASRRGPRPDRRGRRRAGRRASRGSYWEFTHSHRTQGWLIVESELRVLRQGDAVPAGRSTCSGTTSASTARDDPRRIREKVTGKLLALDRALEPTLPAFLWLLDVPVEDAPVAARSTHRSAASARSTRSSACSCARASAQPAPRPVRGSPLDRRRDAGAARRLVESLPDRPRAAARQLPARVPAPLERARATTRQLRIDPLAAGERRRSPDRAPGRRRQPRAAQAAPDRAHRGQPVLPRGERPDAGGDQVR